MAAIEQIAEVISTVNDYHTTIAGAVEEPDLSRPLRPIEDGLSLSGAKCC